MRCHATFVFLAGVLHAQEPPKPPTPAGDPAPAPPPAALDEKAFAALHSLKQDKPPALLGSMVRVGDQQHYLSLPKDKKAPLPAVLLIHEWWGLNDHIKHWADRVAAEGYATLAVDLYGGKVATTADDAQKLMKAVDAAAAKATLKAAFEYLAADTNIQATRRASLGWCFGGAWSLQLAIAEPRLDACVLYYGKLPTDAEQLAKIEAPVLAVFGKKDKSIPKAAVDAFEAAMQKAGKQLRVLRYDAEHAFANPSGANYDQANASKAWTEVRAFLRERLTTPPTKPAAPSK
jgi:carboxymethylenebutenolidase